MSGWQSVQPWPGLPAKILLNTLGADNFTQRALLAWARSSDDVHDEAWREFVTLLQRWLPPAFPLRAADFIARGVEKGPSLGAALARAEEAWIKSGFPMERKALDQMINEALGG